MTDEPDEPTVDRPTEAAAASVIPPGAGLCAACVQARLVVSGRGSQFVLCERSRTDPRFPRYPPLPVRACAGFEPRSSLDGRTRP